MYVTDERDDSEMKKRHKLPRQWPTTHKKRAVSVNHQMLFKSGLKMFKKTFFSNTRNNLFFSH